MKNSLPAKNVCGSFRRPLSMVFVGRGRGRGAFYVILINYLLLYTCIVMMASMLLVTRGEQQKYRILL